MPEKSPAENFRILNLDTEEVDEVTLKYAREIEEGIIEAFKIGSSNLDERGKDQYEGSLVSKIDTSPSKNGEIDFKITINYHRHPDETLSKSAKYDEDKDLEINAVIASVITNILGNNAVNYETQLKTQRSLGRFEIELSLKPKEQS